MVVMADMLRAYEPRLTQLVNEALAARRCNPRRSIANVIERLQDEEIGPELRARMLGALEAALRPFMAADASLDVLMEEWMVGVIWMDICAACAPSLHSRLEKEDGGLGELRQAASSQAGTSSARLLVSTLLNASERFQPLLATVPDV